MTPLRVAIGAIAGAAAAGIALRARRVAQQRDVPLGDVIGDLPEVLRYDAVRLADAAREAVSDGRVAARRKEQEIDRVLQEARHGGAPGSAAASRGDE